LRAEQCRIGGLSQFAYEVHTSASTEQLIACAAASALAQLAGDSVTICRVDHAHARMLVIHNAGELADCEQPWPSAHTFPASEVPHVRQTITSPPSPWTGSVDDVETALGDRELLRKLGKEHALAVAVLFGDTVWGEMYVTRSPGRDSFDTLDVDVATTMAGLLSAGLSRLELLQEMSLLAHTDALTGVANRRAADEWFDQRLSAPEPFPPVTVILCDINGLKPVNDQMGHPAGDQLIRQVADHLVASAGGLTGATVARVGGDEFVVLLAGVPTAEVQKLVQILVDIDIPYAAGLAVGAATTTSRPAGSTSARGAASALLRLADAAQYQHKQTRRVHTETLSTTAPPISVLLPSGGTHLTDRVLAAWDACEDQGVLRRLSVVAHEVALVFGAASWWISRRDGTMLMESMGCLLRPRRTELLPLDLVTGEQFDIDDYPASKVALDGGSYYATLTEGEDSERALVARMGYMSALAAGDRDRGGTGWLVELMGDTATSSGWFVARPLLRALVHLAVTGAQSPPHR